MNRRTFLLGSGAVLVLAACGGDDDDDSRSTATTAGVPDHVRLRTAAALALSAAAKNPTAEAAHRAHAALLDPDVAASHPRADAEWASAADAELALAATCQAWAARLSTPELRQTIMRVGGAAARLYAVALSTPPSLPEAFQLTDPAVPDSWLLD